MTVDELNAKRLKRLKAYPHPYLGCSEFADVLIISRQAFANRRARKRWNMPLPSIQLMCGPLWTKDQAALYILNLQYTRTP